MTQFKVGDRVRQVKDFMWRGIEGVYDGRRCGDNEFSDSLEWDYFIPDEGSHYSNGDPCTFAGKPCGMAINSFEFIDQDNDGMTKIDWSGELEAYHEDGQVVPVKCYGLSEIGKQFIRMELIGGNFTMMQAGLDGYIVNGWRVRNCQPVADERLMRLEAFVARVANNPFDMDFHREAKLLVAEIAPVDIDLVEARKIAMDEYQPSAWNDEQWESRVMAGDEDEDRSVRSALAGIRRGRALERGES